MLASLFLYVDKLVLYVDKLVLYVDRIVLLIDTLILYDDKLVLYVITLVFSPCYKGRFCMLNSFFYIDKLVLFNQQVGLTC